MLTISSAMVVGEICNWTLRHKVSDPFPANEMVDPDGIDMPTIATLWTQQKVHA
jgi:hypothetical protein